MYLRSGLCPEPHRGAYSVPPDTVAGGGPQESLPALGLKFRPQKTWIPWAIKIAAKGSGWLKRLKNTALLYCMVLIGLLDGLLCLCTCVSCSHSSGTTIISFHYGQFPFPLPSAFVLITSVVTNSSTYYLYTIDNSQEFSLFKIVFQ